MSAYGGCRGPERGQGHGQSESGAAISLCDACFLYHVGLFIPCYMDAFEPAVGVTTLQLLERLDCTVDIPVAKCPRYRAKPSMPGGRGTEDEGNGRP
jgi:hypothetical protein